MKKKKFYYQKGPNVCFDAEKIELTLGSNLKPNSKAKGQ